MKDFPITVRFPAHWSEMDAYGHVNNARYFTWFETARIAYLERVGMVDTRGTTNDIGPIIATTQAEYLKPVVFPAQLVVGARVSRIGNTSFTMEYAVEDEAGTLYARGSAVVVTLRYPAYEKIPVPEPLRAAIEKLEGRSFKG
ncbi:thioesterase family protein [Myxococcaceae bacterium GXIMD 01537]